MRALWFLSGYMSDLSAMNNELDSPRGRIYLMKEMLEGAPVNRKDAATSRSLPYLRACETVAPPVCNMAG